MNSYRKTVAHINLDNILYNYRSIEKLIDNKKIIPVVKANAYGHGVIEVTRKLIRNGIDYFAVSLLEEALELRNAFPEIHILVMGVVEDIGISVAAKNSISITITTFDQIEYIQKELKKHLKIHLKVDTGMNRLGFKTNHDILSAYKALNENKYIKLEGLFTHFATADCDKSYYDTQTKRFKTIINLLNHPFEMVHVSNSSSSIKYEKDIDFTTHVRLGISLYGLTLDKETTFLKSAFQLNTKISKINYLSKGDKIGYGITYEAKANEIIGVLPLGYADGFIRKNQGGDVEINGKRYPIVGRICMDQMFVKIDETITKEDEVIVFGRLVSIDEVANRLDTINYEVVCEITNRVPRIYD